MDKDTAKLAKEISDYMANWFGYVAPEEPDEFEQDLAAHLLALFGRKK